MKLASKAEKAVAKEPRTLQGMLTEALKESTEKFISEEDKQEVEEANRKSREEAKKEKEADEKRKREQAALFRRGAKKARNEIFSENHHIYTDATGFKYDVVLTKVDTRQNRNERYALTLQIYESNTLPATYALNLAFAGTSLLPSNNVLAAIGSNFATAFRTFKVCFRGKTGVEWDDRITAAVERAKAAKRQRGQGTGSPEGTERGRPVSETSDMSRSKEQEEVEFGKRMFVYHPPLYGPRGLLPEAQEGDGFSQTSPEADANRRGDAGIEAWMSGANGAGPDALETVEGGAEMQDTQPDGMADGFVDGETAVLASLEGGDGTHGIPPTNDFDNFLHGAWNAANGVDGVAETGLAPHNQNDAVFDFGDTGYPFGNGQVEGGEFDFGLGDDSMPDTHTPYAPGGDGEQQETQGYTQAVLDAGAQLEEMMEDIPSSATLVQEVEATLDLASSLLSRKRKATSTSPPVEGESVDAAENFAAAPETFTDEAAYALEQGPSDQVRDAMRRAVPAMMGDHAMGRSSIRNRLLAPGEFAGDVHWGGEEAEGI